MSPNAETAFSRLVNIMNDLREKCPWDRKQTHRSLRPMILEEVYELLEAIDQDDDHALKEELGDVLLHVLFHAQLARERQPWCRSFCGCMTRGKEQ